LDREQLTEVGGLGGLKRVVGVYVNTRDHQTAILKTAMHKIAIIEIAIITSHGLTVFIGMYVCMYVCMYV